MLALDRTVTLAELEERYPRFPVSAVVLLERPDLAAKLRRQEHQGEGHGVSRPVRSDSPATRRGR